jgi:DNA polymerase-3 subunit delta
MAKLNFKTSAAQYEKILADLKQRKFSPVYVLMGEEPYFIDKIDEYIAENVLDESQKAFNRLILYGKDTDVRTIVESSLRPPMMSEYQLVIVREAQVFKVGSDDEDEENTGKKRRKSGGGLNDMEPYLNNPLKSTILVICYKGKTIDKRSKFYKLLEKKAVILETVKMYDNETSGWISDYIRKKGATIEPGAAMLLAEYIGTDLSRIVNELDKLSLVLPANNKKITVEHIERNIGISKEYNALELSNALMARNNLKAHKIVNYFAQNPKAGPMEQVVPLLAGTFIKLLRYIVLKNAKYPEPSASIAAKIGVHPFFLKEYDTAAKFYNLRRLTQIIEQLREYDMKNKGVGSADVPDAELLKELIFKILN